MTEVELRTTVETGRVVDEFRRVDVRAGAVVDDVGATVLVEAVLN